jgi:hypothetical protein
MDTRHWITRIDRITEDFKNDFGSLTAEQLNWKQHAGSWSIAQNVHHLMVINESYYPAIKEIRANTYTVPWIGRIGFMRRFFARVILNSVQPDRKRKMKTFPLWEPSVSAIDADILHRFEAHQEVLKKLITDSHDLLERGVVLSSPANKNIVYTLADAFEIMVTHEARHLEQAREVYNAYQKSVYR